MSFLFRQRPYAISMYELNQTSTYFDYKLWQIREDNRVFRNVILTGIVGGYAMCLLTWVVWSVFV
jgi:hypothetical protein